jgi:hypothetical protein
MNLVANNLLQLCFIFEKTRQFHDFEDGKRTFSKLRFASVVILLVISSKELSFSILPQNVTAVHQIRATVRDNKGQNGNQEKIKELT